MHLWSFCIGARNALAGVGALIGLGIVHYGDESTGMTVVVVSCIYMLLASLSWASPTCSATGAPAAEASGERVASSVLPAIALIAIAV